MICDDFNIDILKMDGTHPKAMKRIIQDNGMKQLVKETTRISQTMTQNGQRTSKTMIDLVITNDYSIRANVMTAYKITDHSTIDIKI
jgi:chemotaxis regulatin CheY-phosphate phosphatase CheZ